MNKQTNLPEKIQKEAPAAVKVQGASGMATLDDSFELQMPDETEQEQFEKDFFGPVNVFRAQFDGQSNMLCQQ